MRSTKVIHIVSCHAEGEVGDVIVGGVAPPPGDTLWDQARWIAQNQELRNLVLQEPRGGVFRHVNLLVPPKNPKAAAAWIIMEPIHTPPMSGSNSICVSTVLLDTGIIPMEEPVTKFTLEAPGGLVDVEAECCDGKAKRIKIQNHPSFADKMDANLEVEGLGSITVDTAYGGDSFAFVDAKALGFSLEPHEAKDIATLGVKITKAATEQLGFSHPTNPDWNHISFCFFSGSMQKRDGTLTSKGALVIEPGKLDRSPCGTGISARMALMHARGQMKVGDPFIGTSIIDSEFHGRIESETMVGDKPAIVPSLSGRAWITGTHQLMVDPDDPWPTGYRVGDTWPMI